jgi:hypothetical protein
MGIPLQVLKAFSNETRSSSCDIKKIALFGRQTVHADSNDLGSLGLASLSELEPDTYTRHSGSDLYSDRSVLKSIFPGSEIDIFDRSSYEGANVLVDLNKPLPSSFHSRYDLVFTGGCLDNVFNPSAALINSSYLLSDNGIVIHYEAAANLIGCFQYFSSEWFHGYYSSNKFSDCKSYLLQHKDPAVSRFKYETNLYVYSPFFVREKAFDYLESGLSMKGLYYNLIIAQKSPESTNDAIPIQLQYIDQDSFDWTSQQHVFDKNPRLLLKGTTFDQDLGGISPLNSSHYKYLGSGF